MRKSLGFILILWALLFAISNMADAQITEKVKVNRSGYSLEVKTGRIDSVNASYSDVIDISNMDGQTIYYTGWAHARYGNANDSLRVALLGYWKTDSLEFYVGLDTFYIPARSTSDSARTLTGLQTPSLSLTGYAPQIKLQLLSYGAGTINTTVKSITKAFFAIYARQEDVVPANRHFFNYVAP